MNSKPITKQKANLGQGNAVVHIYSKNLGQVLIPVPPTSEQIAISNALFETDSLISSLEKLILKKQNMRQAATQVLFTGRKRLKGFKGEWSRVRLSELGNTYGGLSGKSKKDFKNGTSYYVPFLNVMTNPIIDTSYFDMVSIRQGESQNKVRKGDLLFNGSSETPEEVGMCSILLNEIPDLYLNSFCFGFRLKKESLTDGLYLIYFLRSNEGRKLIFSLVQGATR